MADDQRWYHLNRAKASLEQAKAAQNPTIARIHLELHDRHMALADTPAVAAQAEKTMVAQPRPA